MIFDSCEHKLLDNDMFVEQYRLMENRERIYEKWKKKWTRLKKKWTRLDFQKYEKLWKKKYEKFSKQFFVTKRKDFFGATKYKMLFTFIYVQNKRVLRSYMSFWKKKRVFMFGVEKILYFHEKLKNRTCLAHIIHRTTYGKDFFFFSDFRKK